MGIGNTLVNCPHCGTPVENGAKFCTACGWRVREGDWLVTTIYSDSLEPDQRPLARTYENMPTGEFQARTGLGLLELQERVGELVEAVDEIRRGREPLWRQNAERLGFVGLGSAVLYVMGRLGIDPRAWK